MNALLPVLGIHAWFWLVAAISISFHKAPMLTAVAVLAAVAMFIAGYCCGWTDRKTAELHEDDDFDNPFH